jgi:hypothetical protein
MPNLTNERFYCSWAYCNPGHTPGTNNKAITKEVTLVSPVVDLDGVKFPLAAQGEVILGRGELGNHGELRPCDVEAPSAAISPCYEILGTADNPWDNGFHDIIGAFGLQSGLPHELNLDGDVALSGGDWSSSEFDYDAEVAFWEGFMEFARDRNQTVWAQLYTGVGLAWSRFGAGVPGSVPADDHAALAEIVSRHADHWMYWNYPTGVVDLGSPDGRFLEWPTTNNDASHRLNLAACGQKGVCGGYIGHYQQYEASLAAGTHTIKLKDDRPNSRAWETFLEKRVEVFNGASWEPIYLRDLVGNECTDGSLDDDGGGGLCPGNTSQLSCDWSCDSSFESLTFDLAETSQVRVRFMPNQHLKLYAHVDLDLPTATWEFSSGMDPVFVGVMEAIAAEIDAWNDRR